MRQPTTIPKLKLLDLIWTKPVSALAKEFGVSPNGLAKICDRLDIPRPPKGYWRSELISSRVQKPQNITDPEFMVQIGGRSSRQRRPRSRMSRDDRLAQMLEATKNVIIQYGLHHVTLKTVAKKCEMSEAQAHNIFSTREDLLVELGYREALIIEKLRLENVARGGSRIAKIVLSNLGYLRHASSQGSVLQQVLRDSNIRKRIDKRRLHIRSEAAEKYIDFLQREGTDRTREDAFALLSVMIAMLVRSGELVAEGRLTLEEAERIQLPISIKAALV